MGLQPRRGHIPGLVILCDGVSIAKSGGRFHDISAIFAGETKPLYFDFCHMAEEGNQAVALHMIDPVLETLNASR